MLQLFRTSLHNPCSTVWNVQAIQTCVQQSSVWAKRRIHLLAISRQSLVGCDDPCDPDVTGEPILSARRDSWHPPKSFSIANAWFADKSGLVLHHRDLEYRPHARELPRSSRGYQPKYAVFCRLFSCPHRNRAAPLFGRLGALTVQDRGTGLRMTPFGSPCPFSQGVMNVVPGSIQTPVAKVGVNGFPGRQIMWHGVPLTASSQNVENPVDDLASHVVCGTAAAFHGWN